MMTWEVLSFISVAGLTLRSMPYSGARSISPLRCLCHFLPLHSTSPTDKMDKYEAALQKIDAAHSQDPRLTTGTDNATQIPYELHYATKMTHYLEKRLPTAPPLLRLAIRAQHLRRWEIPRSTYPQTKPGYYAWRRDLQNRQAEIAMRICVESGYGEGEAERVGKLVRKEGLKREDDEEVQVLEDVACLVFLEDRFEGFKEGMNREAGDGKEKVVEILKKTLLKMSPVGRELAMEEVVGGLSVGGRELVMRALEGLEG